jgi:hypothetical protein
MSRPKGPMYSLVMGSSPGLHDKASQAYFTFSTDCLSVVPPIGACWPAHLPDSQVLL